MAEQLERAARPFTPARQKMGDPVSTIGSGQFTLKVDSSGLTNPTFSWPKAEDVLRKNRQPCNSNDKQLSHGQLDSVGNLQRGLVFKPKQSIGLQNASRIDGGRTNRGKVRLPCGFPLTSPRKRPSPPKRAVRPPASCSCGGSSAPAQPCPSSITRGSWPCGLCLMERLLTRGKGLGF